MRIEELWRKAISGEKGFFYDLFRFLLHMLSFLYLPLFVLFRWAQSLRPVKLPCPVISIGNLTLGGTGKTSLAILLARRLEEMGYKVAILCTGYGGKSQGKVRGKGVKEVGDEAFLLSANLEKGDVWAGRDRVKMAWEAIKEGAEVIILDDAMQYFRIEKDLEIAMLNAFSPFGYGYLFPRGSLREPITGLRRAQVIILNNADAVDDKGEIIERIRRINPSALIFEANYRSKELTETREGTIRGLDWLKGKKVMGVAGIGCPEGFRKTLEGLAGEVYFKAFPDHYDFKRKDIISLLSEAKMKGLSAIVMTEKDGIKIKELMGKELPQEVPFFVLRVELVISPHEPFWRKIRSVLF
ncbi:tetraacyldisaccharide 4'-kinase [bacterium]|nr:tetraacyldisaccharide 4'-kinase [bacterium]